MKTLKFAGVACVLLVLDIAAAQSAESAKTEQSAVLEEIIVTARQREENIQEVPVAVTNISGALVESAHSASLIDIEKFMPNVEMSVLQTAGRWPDGIETGQLGYDDTAEPWSPLSGCRSTAYALDLTPVQQPCCSTSNQFKFYADRRGLCLGVIPQAGPS